MAITINPLDLQTLFINVFSGSYTVFAFISVVIIAAMAARFRMNNFMFFIMLGLFSVFMAAWISWLYAFMIVILGLGIFFIIGRIIKN